MRVLHARHRRHHGGVARRKSRTRPRPRSATRCPATCAAAPATTTSSRRSPRRQRGDARAAGHDRNAASSAAALLRSEDYRFVTGQGRYLDDIVVPGACMRISSARRMPMRGSAAIDIDAARRSAEGVIAIVGGRELARWTTSVAHGAADRGIAPGRVHRRCRSTRSASLAIPSLASSPRDRYLAEDAAELVNIDYDELDAVPDLDRALAAGAPLVDDSLPNNLISQQSFTAGDPGRILREAEIVVEAIVPSASPDPRADRNARLLRVWDAGPAASDHAYRQPGAASRSGPSSPARMRLNEVADHGRLSGYRRRLRPEDRALSRGAHRRGAGARICGGRCAGARTGTRT